MIEAEKGGEGAWDLKQAPGGLVDIEFIAQYVELMHGAAHPELLSTETECGARRSGEGRAASASEVDLLRTALELYQALMQILRLCVDGIFHPEAAPRGLLDRLARAGDTPDFATLDRHLRETQTTVRASFERLIGPVPRPTAATLDG